MTEHDFVVTADWVFDGYRVLPHHAVLVTGERITAVLPRDQARGGGRRIDIAGTVLPGFIDLHAHLLLDRTPADVVLRHGVTTVRDTGGPWCLRPAATADCGCWPPARS
jgi:imidazolonepropionase-like amidohydrolase